MHVILFLSGQELVMTYKMSVIFSLGHNRFDKVLSQTLHGQLRGKPEPIFCKPSLTYGKSPQDSALLSCKEVWCSNWIDAFVSMFLFGLV